MEFANSTDFTNSVRSFNPTPDYPNLCSLIGAFLAISNGCSCSKNSRINNYNNIFNNLPNVLTQIEKNFLKTSLDADKINIVGSWEISLV